MTFERRLKTPLMRLTMAGAILAVALASVVVPREEAEAQDYIADLSAALSGWGAPYADFEAKGAEIIADFTVIFDTAWMAEWQADLNALDAVAAALAGITLPGDADADLAMYIGDIAADTAGQTQAARDGMNNIASDNGAALTAAYGALAETDAKVNGSIALVQAAGGSVAPGDTGNAGIAAQQSSTEATSLAAFALVALLLVGGARVATARIRRG